MASETPEVTPDDNMNPTIQDEDQDNHLATPPPEKSRPDVLPIMSGGSVDELWPGGCGDQLPILQEDQTRKISSEPIEETMEM